MRILIIDQCSGSKKSSDRTEPLDKDTIDSKPREALVNQDGTESYRAEELYEGRQQQRITDAKQLLENAGDEVDRVFISAGFGIVDSSDTLPLYDVTFADMSKKEINERVEELSIHQDARDLIEGSDYDIIFFALGSDYYESARIDELLSDISEDTFLVFFNREALEEEYENAVSIPARTSQAKEYGTIVVALKGKYLHNFGSNRASGKEVRSIDQLEAYCREEPNSQVGLEDYSSNNR
jgi:hypothetical protein